MATRKPSGRSKRQTIQLVKCSDLKAALAKEIRAQVKDRELRARLIERLSGEVAYGTGGGGGGVGVA